MRTIAGIDELMAATGTELGVSEWQHVTQAMIDGFATVTGDRYWIHTDPEQAAASEIGTTIAHGLLTLSLGPAFSYAIVAFEGFAAVLNYGYDRVRFPAPLTVDSEVRMTLDLLKVDSTTDGARARLRQTFDARGNARPVCVAEQVLHLMADAGHRR
ncbi:MAG: MaoC family dehydratase [Sciscionella sp.]